MPDEKYLGLCQEIAPQPEVARDNLRDVATFLFGDDWREGAARVLRTDRRALVRELASDEPVRQEIWLALSSTAEERLERVWQEHTEILELIRTHLHSSDFHADTSIDKTRRLALSPRALKPRASKG